MKIIQLLSGMMLISGIATPAMAQNTTAGKPVTSVADIPFEDGTTGNVLARKAASDAEQSRAVAEARRKKALMEAMAKISPASRRPVISNADDFLKYNRPPVPETNTGANKPYKVPVVYDDVPQFQTGNPANRKVDDEGRRNSTGGSAGNNPYSYPGRVSEGSRASVPPEPDFSPATPSGKKRPGFFKWLKNRKSSGSENNTADFTTPPPLADTPVSATENDHPVSPSSGVPVAAGENGETAVSGTPVTAPVEAPSPPNTTAGNDGSPGGSPVVSPQSGIVPTTAAEENKPKKKGLLKRLFKRKR